MTKTLALLFASTALAAGVGLPAWSATRTPGDGASQSAVELFDVGRERAPLVLVSDDDDHEDDDDEDRGDRRSSQTDDDDEEEDDADDDQGGARHPAPIAPTAPPQNGLFVKGAPPQVQVN
ncbi:hypothetical protein [Hansschlegelia zhihuaiae]|uniref:Uncharacterized protein n=1 Tax=Hansschlegelia zhihuaiae TaxID=405005 RepID=A0A4Q0MP12_9HYPH|nr:hypothetical protein [Hansschlegelia zhihuaiae]RXF75578.1 hypothetical protein EK403_01650 [Hansschlegelia zhihuaiae]